MDPARRVHGLNRGQRLIDERAPRRRVQRRTGDHVGERAALEQLEDLVRAGLRVRAGVEQPHPALVRERRRRDDRGPDRPVRDPQRDLPPVTASRARKTRASPPEPSSVPGS
ncbi:MAG: hypothetical protein WDO13_10390 [Verrucomicrobiota bacterium]